MNLVSGEEKGVAGSEVIDVNGQQMFGQGVLALEMPDGRAEAAIGHVASAAGEPVEHSAPAVHEHVELLAGFGDVRDEAEVVAAGGIGGEAQQFGVGGIGRVRGKSDAGMAGGKGGDFIEGFADDFGGRAAAFDAGHFQEGEDAQWGGGPGFREQFGHHLDVADGGRAGARSILAPSSHDWANSE